MTISLSDLREHMIERAGDPLGDRYTSGVTALLGASETLIEIAAAAKAYWLTKTISDQANSLWYSGTVTMSQSELAKTCNDASARLTVCERRLAAALAKVEL